MQIFSRTLYKNFIVLLFYEAFFLLSVHIFSATTQSTNCSIMRGVQTIYQIAPLNPQSSRGALPNSLPTLD